MFKTHPEMDSKQNKSCFVSPINNDIQDLLKEIKDTNSKLQSLKDEEEEVNMDIHNCRAELDHRMLLLMHVDKRLWDALQELDAVQREKEKLVQQLRELADETRTTQLSTSVSHMQKEEALLLKEQNDLKQQCEQLKKILKEARKNKNRGQDAMKRRETSKDSHSQNVTTAKPGGKEVTWK